MRFRLGPVPDEPGFRPEEGDWVRLREPSTAVMMLCVLPVAALVTTALVFAWSRVGIRETSGRIDVVGLAVFLVAGVALLLVHELLHAVALPRFGSSASTTLGFWPKWMTPYISHEGELPRGRNILVALMPFLVLSIAPLVACIIFPPAPLWAVVLSVLNGIGASADLVAATLIAVQVPASGFVRNRAHETWWRTPDTTDASN